MSKLIDISKVNLIYFLSKIKKLNIDKYQLERMINSSNKKSSFYKYDYEAEQRFISDIRKSKNSEDLSKRIIHNREKYATQKNKLRLDIIMYPTLHKLDNNISTKFIPLNIANSILDNNHNIDDIINLENNYSDILTNYISDHNSIKNKLYQTHEGIADYTKPFSKEMLEECFTKLKENESNDTQFSINTRIQTLIFNVLVPIMSLYSSNDLKSNKDLIEFEMKSGYFDKYYNDLQNGIPIPSISERKKFFNDKKMLTPLQIKLFNEVKILQSKISQLKNEKTKETLLKVLDNSIKEQSYEKLEKVHEYYQKAYKEEIVKAMFSPKDKNLHVLENYDDLQTIMIHSFFRTPESILKRYEEQLTKEIIASRKNNNNDTTLSPLEQDIFEGKMKKAREQLANQVITDKTFDMDSVYSDASNIHLYKSNTSNQLSVSVISPENILKLNSSIGIGFDQKGLSSENILLSSSKYLTTNKGLNNIELPGSELEYASTPLSEMEKSLENEIVLARNGDNYSTKASYVFVSITEKNNEYDLELLEKGKKLAKENNLPLVIINVAKLQQSYNDNLNKDKKTSR